MKIRSIVLLTLLFTAFSVRGQQNEKAFTKKTVITGHTPVISQGSTGTCWSFATTSFLEAEIIRKGLPETNLSEMYFVYHAYRNKAKKYLLYHGNNNFSQGGQAHDVMDVIREHGLVTYEDFPGKKKEGKYQHRDLARDLQKKVDQLNKEKNDFTLESLKKTDPLLRKHMGRLPRKVNTPEGKVTPEAFREHLGIDPGDYIELTSFSHHPFYQPFVLEVPDNWSHALYYNLPVDELIQVMVYALENGHTVCWDGDTSEKTFSHKDGVADLPANQKGKVTQDLRQETFYSRTTTDDHLMHIVGLYEDQSGKPAFFTKNSWGTDSNEMNGYLMLTEDYVRLKTIAVLVHKEAIPKSIREKLKR